MSKKFSKEQRLAIGQLIYNDEITIYDPACGTFGFMIAAHAFVAKETDEFSTLDAGTANFEDQEAFSGTEACHD